MRISDGSSDVCSSDLTVRTVADALRATQPTTARVIACGGGVHNGALMDALAGAMPGCTVESSAAHGLDPDSVEAMGFAWLARQTLLGLPGKLPSVSGAKGPRVRGGIYASVGATPPTDSTFTAREVGRGACREREWRDV